MKKPKFLAKQEIGATPFADMLTDFINVRFLGFLGAFADLHGIQRDKAFETARELLSNAEIPQDE